MRGKNENPPLVFSPFSCKMQIRRQLELKKNAVIRNATANAVPPSVTTGLLSSCRANRDRVQPTGTLAVQVNFLKGSKAGRASPVGDAATYIPLPSESVLRSSGRNATARIVQRLTKNTAPSPAPGQTCNMRMMSPYSKMDGSGLVQECNRVYTNDVLYRQLHSRSPKGRLPQSKPGQFLWEAGEAYCARYPLHRQRQVISVGYQIQFPLIHKSTTSRLTKPEKIFLSGHNLRVKTGTPMKSRPPKQHFEYIDCWINSATTTEHEVPLTNLYGKKIPRLKYSQSNFGGVSSTPRQQLHTEDIKEQRRAEILHSVKERNPPYGESPL